MLHEFIVTHRDEIITRTGHTAHEARDFLSTAFLAFHALKRGDVAINGSTGAMLGRSLMALRDLRPHAVGGAAGGQRPPHGARAGGTLCR